MGRATTTWSLFAFSLPLLFLYLAIRGVPRVDPGFWPVLALNVGLDVLGFTLYVRALQEGDLGLTYPLLALTPALVVPVEWLVLGQHVGLRGAAGIALVVTGVYLLVSPGDRRGLLAPFRALSREPGARRMLAVTVVWAVSGTFDRVAVLRSSPAFYCAALTTCLAIAFLPVALRRAGRAPRLAGPEPGPTGPGPAGADAGPSRGGSGPAASLLGTVREHPGELALQGLLWAAMFVTQMEALRLALAAYVLTLKRSGTLLTVLAGAAFFGEGETRRRLLATFVLLGGVVLVSLA